MRCTRCGSEVSYYKEDGSNIFICSRCGEIEPNEVEFKKNRLCTK